MPNTTLNSGAELAAALIALGDGPVIYDGDGDRIGYAAQALLIGDRDAVVFTADYLSPYGGNHCGMILQDVALDDAGNIVASNGRVERNRDPAAGRRAAQEYADWLTDSGRSIQTERAWLIEAHGGIFNGKPLS